MRDPIQQPERVTLGVDTHAEQHVAAALDERGRLLGTCTIPTTTSGFAELVRWASAYGELGQVGIEGTGSYGAGLARWLRAQNVAVINVGRPDRRTRRRLSRKPWMLKQRQRRCSRGLPLPSPRLAPALCRRVSRSS